MGIGYSVERPVYPSTENERKVSDKPEVCRYHCLVDREGRTPEGVCVDLNRITGPPLTQVLGRVSEAPRTVGSRDRVVVPRQRRESGVDRNSLCSGSPTKGPTLPFEETPRPTRRRRNSEVLDRSVEPNTSHLRVCKYLD